MTDMIAFECRVEPVAWGKSVYTIIRLPPDAALVLAGARRVEGDIADHPVNLAISRAPVVDGPFLWAGSSLLAKLGVAPGDTVEARLRPVSPGIVEAPDDVLSALRASGASAAWDTLTPGRRRGLLYGVETARTAATRGRRIATLVATVLAGDAGPPVRRTARRQAAERDGAAHG